MEAIDKVISFPRPVFPDSELEFICFPIKRKLPLLLCGLFRGFIPFLISSVCFFSFLLFIFFSFFLCFLFFLPHSFSVPRFYLPVYLKRVLFGFKEASSFMGNRIGVTLHRTIIS